jgi:TMEM175 potassium channel family protein
LSTKAFTPRIRLEHVIAFSDAVFAFAITLMALTIDIPGLSSNLTETQLIESLFEMSSQVESYVLSFFIIALFWVSYHQVFNHIKDSYLSMVYLNLLFLLLITLLSISTSLVINFDSYRVAYLIYYGVVIAASTLLVVIWWYAIRINAVENLHPMFKKGLFIQLLILPLVFLLSIVVSFINLNVAQYFWLIIIPLSIYIRHKFKH